MNSPAKRELGRTLITGAAGFLGEAAARTLRAQGIEVIATDVNISLATSSPAILGCDVSDLAQIDDIMGSNRIDTILHCGGVSGPMVLADRPDLIWRINALGTANILEAARRHAVKRVVICSTSDVYGYQRQGMLNELALPDPPSVYAASKVAAEQAMLGYIAEHRVNAVAIRLAWIYGPGRKTRTFLHTMLSNGFAGHRTEVEGYPGDMVHYFFIDDAVAGLLGAATVSDPPHRIYNISGGRGQTLGAIAEAVRLAIPGARIEFKSDSIGCPGPAGLDHSRARNDFGYDPSISLRDGIALYCRSLAQNANAELASQAKLPE